MNGGERCWEKARERREDWERGREQGLLKGQRKAGRGDNNRNTLPTFRVLSLSLSRLFFTLFICLIFQCS